MVIAGTGPTGTNTDILVIGVRTELVASARSAQV